MPLEKIKIADLRIDDLIAFMQQVRAQRGNLRVAVRDEERQVDNLASFVEVRKFNTSSSLYFKAEDVPDETVLVVRQDDYGL